MMQQGCVYEMAVNVFNMLNDTSSGKYWEKKKKRIEENQGAGEMCFKKSRNVYTQKYATVLIFLCTLEMKLAIIMNFCQKF